MLLMQTLKWQEDTEISKVQKNEGLKGKGVVFQNIQSSH